MIGDKPSENTKRKLHLYFAAVFLFNKGKSHPQVIEILSAFDSDNALVETIVDKAMHEEWDKLYEEGRQMFSNGMIYTDVVKVIAEKESDQEIAMWICKTWYELKTMYMECLIESPTNIFEGLKGVIVCSLGTLLMFLIDSSLILKGIWIAALVFSLAQWIVGLQQRDISYRIKSLFALDE